MMAAGDLDFDGDDEIVIATATPHTTTITISVLDFAVSPTLAITLHPLSRTLCLITPM